MIESKVIKEEKKEEMKYPWLGIADDNMIVLFSDYYEGTVINAGDNLASKVGRHSNTWCINYFKSFKGAVELKNKLEK